MSRSAAARTVVGATGAIVLVIGAVPAVVLSLSAIASETIDRSDPSRTESGLNRDRLHHAQFECIRESVVRQVAPGSTVFVPLDPATVEAPLWHQRLSELAYPVATIVETPGPATLTLRIAGDPASKCGGVRLVVEQG